MSREAIDTQVTLEYLKGKSGTTLWGRIYSLKEQQDLVDAAAWFTKQVNDFADWLVEKGYADVRGVIENAEEVPDSSDGFDVVVDPDGWVAYPNGEVGPEEV